jgi:hypothetical protein
MWQDYAQTAELKVFQNPLICNAPTIGRALYKPRPTLILDIHCSYFSALPVLAESFVVYLSIPSGM